MQMLRDISWLNCCRLWIDISTIPLLLVLLHVFFLHLWTYWSGSSRMFENVQKTKRTEIDGHHVYTILFFISMHLSRPFKLHAPGNRIIYHQIWTFGKQICQALAQLCRLIFSLPAGINLTQDILIPRWRRIALLNTATPRGVFRACLYSHNHARWL